MQREGGGEGGREGRREKACGDRAAPHRARLSERGWSCCVFFLSLFLIFFLCLFAWLGELALAAELVGGKGECSWA